ncbi:MAG: septum formation initiator family protein [Bacteroidia bacterium]
MKKVFLRILPLLKNKYFLVTLGVLVWVLFFDKNDIWSQLDLTRQVNKLRAEKKYFTTEIQNNKKDLEELKTNPKNLEKFARENYLMKKDNEVIYVIVPEKKAAPQAISANRSGAH